MKNKKLWQVLKFVNQWQMYPFSLFLGNTIGDVLLLPEDVQVESSSVFVTALVALLLFSLSLLFQVQFGASFERKINQKIDLINQENTKLLEIHSELDNLRDRLIFEDDNEYWEILEKLPIT